MAQFELEDTCQECGKPRGDVDGLAPVSHGRYHLGPEWSCYECMDIEMLTCKICGQEFSERDGSSLCIECLNDITKPCPRCGGTGQIRDIESQIGGKNE